MNPFELLKEAIRAVPAVRYALGISGVIAAIALVAALRVDLRIAVFGTIIMIVLMVLLVVFARLSVAAPPVFIVPIVILVWSSVLLCVLTAALLFASVFFQWPLDLHRWLDPAKTSLVTDVPPETSKQELLDILNARHRLGVEQLTSLYEQASDPKTKEQIEQLLKDYESTASEARLALTKGQLVRYHELAKRLLALLAGSSAIPDEKRKLLIEKVCERYIPPSDIQKLRSIYKDTKQA